jgi:hypothetical protein
MIRSALITAFLLLLAAKAGAESKVSNAPGPGTVAARLNFQVTIPPVLYLRVGSGSAPAYTTGGSRNQIRFDVPFFSMGTGASIAARADDGDICDGPGQCHGRLTVRWFNNIGTSTQVSVGVLGEMYNASGRVIPWSEIQVTTSPLASPTPGFSNGAAVHPASVPNCPVLTPCPIVTTAGPAEAVWTYSYRNSAVLQAGSYGGSSRNGRLVYTATAL